MSPQELFDRYRELQQYVGWSEEDPAAIARVRPLLLPILPSLIEDFYNQVLTNPHTRIAITGGDAQVQRLKGTLQAWLVELLEGPYDSEYVQRRWRVGRKHVEIGLPQVFTSAALSRIRRRLTAELLRNADVDPVSFLALDRLIDLDLAIVEEAYTANFVLRVQEADRVIAQARQQELELARRRSEANLGALLESAPCLIVILRPDLHIAYVGPHAEELTGLPPQAFIGRLYTELMIREEKRAEFRDIVARVLQGETAHGFEHRITGADGREHWQHMNARRLDDYEGGPAILVVGLDITSLKAAQDQALQSARLAAIGQMMTGLAHESGNALARSMACLEMLEMEVEDRPEALDFIRRIRAAQDHLRQLYEEVRGYAAPVNLCREPGNVSQVWRQAWNHLMALHQGSDADLQEHLKTPNVGCPLDAFRLEQVFRNIFENALAACGPSLRIAVTVEDEKLNEKPALRINIRDNGPGLTPEQKRRIFEPFFTTKIKGTGLGMAITQRIVQAHGGRIFVGESEGPGAEIVVVLPRSESLT